MWTSPFLPRAHPGTVFGLWTTQGHQERVKDLPFYLHWSMSSSTYSNDCNDQGFDPSVNRFSDEWPRWPVVSVSPSLLSEDSLPSISSLSQGLRIQNALQVLLRSQSVIYQVLNSHWYCFGRILWSIVVTFNTPSWSIWYLAASLDPSGLPWVRYSNFCDNFKI